MTLLLISTFSVVLAAPLVSIHPFYYLYPLIVPRKTWLVQVKRFPCAIQVFIESVNCGAHHVLCSGNSSNAILKVQDQEQVTRVETGDESRNQTKKIQTRLYPDSKKSIQNSKGKGSWWHLRCTVYFRGCQAETGPFVNKKNTSKILHMASCAVSSCMITSTFLFFSFFT